MVITLKKKSMPLLLIDMILFAICFGRFFIDIFGFPGVIKYVSDGLIIILIGYIFRKLFYRRAVYLSENVKKILLSILIIISVILVSAIFDKSPLMLMLWGFRNTFKGIILFVACVLFWKKEDITRLAKKINFILLINAVICVYEYFVLDLQRDNVGGIFGTSEGCNAPLNVFLIIATAWNALRYAEKKQRIWKTLFFVGLCAGIAGMAELKIYIVEVLVVMLVVGAFSKGIIKKIVLMLAGVVFVLVSIHFVETLIPDWEGFFTVENMWEMLTDEDGYTNQGDLNRFTSMQMLNKMIFREGTNWFGIGLGNAEYSDSYDFLNSKFYSKYGHLHYGWFTIAKTYIELGYFGILSMLFVWINCAGVAIKGAIRAKDKQAVYCKMAITMAIVTPILFIYNSTMHIDSSCLVYACMSLGYIVTREKEGNYYDKEICEKASL